MRACWPATVVQNDFDAGVFSTTHSSSLTSFEYFIEACLHFDSRQLVFPAAMCDAC